MPIAPGDGLEEGEEVDMDENVHCVNGYCIDRKYNKLELPSAGKTHVRMNLEVSRRGKKSPQLFNMDNRWRGFQTNLHLLRQKVG